MRPRNPLRACRIICRMPTDFRDGRTFPRRGREAIGETLWLLRAADKGRAAAAGTIHDYIYPCPMDAGMMDRWGITPDEFDDALRRNSTDESLYAWFSGRVRPDDIRAANEWLLRERSENLDRQDDEEVVPVQRR
jgi:Domain of unknown function (DUF5069)